MPGIKHLIECHCYLAIYKNKEMPINHKFCVFSKLNEFGDLIPRTAKCNNCDAFHLVYDVGKSEIKHGKDQSNVVLKKEDIIISLPVKLSNILNNYDADISNWEHVLDIYENKEWGKSVVLKRDIVNEKTQIKLLTMNSKDSFKIETEVIDDLIVRE
tara:strand:+ start:2595 stop:3065 length:471 start_codon:yes stop_codon:yes gene_type:complete